MAHLSKPNISHNISSVIITIICSPLPLVRKRTLCRPGKEKNTLPPWYWYCVLRMGATESTVLGGSRASGPHACGPVDAAAGQGLQCAHNGITRKPACAQPSQRGPLAHEPENGKAAVRRRGGVAVGEAGMRAGDR